MGFVVRSWLDFAREEGGGGGVGGSMVYPENCSEVATCAPDAGQVDRRYTGGTVVVIVTVSRL